MTTTPIGPCPDPITEIVTMVHLAERLGVTRSAIRQALHVQASWLPRPDGKINGGWVWRAESLRGIEDVPRSARPAEAAAPSHAPLASAPPGSTTQDAPGEDENEWWGE